MSAIAAGERDLSHGELDRLEQTPVLAHLRSELVATGTLPPRDEQMAGLERSRQANWQQIPSGHRLGARAVPL